MEISSWNDFLGIVAIGLTSGLVVGFTCLAVRYAAVKLDSSIRIATSIR